MIHNLNAIKIKIYKQNLIYLSLPFLSHKILSPTGTIRINFLYIIPEICQGYANYYIHVYIC